ncbi:uncharacterized protein I303_106073 [Kwoniella dejecticola CBS 10117]|uniref:Uncharacterized protein n=1 Tax=Kwoniella dejecticola CBS 10117 TaxID=1296121 RepID=A0A1A6A180_9TREE|nr:uncharacterized protein I303_06093 [Kwoniella dejecticola CBS 10117]OBR83810.1 hypothetical protein I303_06093 [Kwoniella dejecticola CBS 10117]
MLYAKSFLVYATILGMLGYQALAANHAKYKISLPEGSKITSVGDDKVLATGPKSYEFDAFDESGKLEERNFDWVGLSDKDSEKWKIQLTASAGYPWSEDKVATYTLSLKEPWVTIPDNFQAAHLSSEESSFECLIEPCGPPPVFDA